MRGFTMFLISLVGPVLAGGQETLPVHVHFGFGTPAVATRFREKSQPSIEQQITNGIAQICSKALPPWQCDTAQQPSPNIDVSVQSRDDKWYLKAVLTPRPSGTDLKGEWNEQQIFTAEQLIAMGGLPMDDGWIAPIETAFEQFVSRDAKSGKELFAALKEVAPLGKSVVLVPLNVYPLPGAVLPLRWDQYQELATSRVRIYYHGKNGELITIVASGSGGPIDFTPDAPQYKAVWVLHDTYQIGARPPEPITTHVQELPDLTAIEFHLEDLGTLPPGLSVAH